MVDETQQYSVAEMEQMMKVQDVLLKAMARKITWWAAAAARLTKIPLRNERPDPSSDHSKKYGSAFR